MELGSPIMTTPRSDDSRNRSPATPGTTGDAPLVVGINAGPSARRVLAVAGQLGELIRARVLVVHATRATVIVPSVGGMIPRQTPPEDWAVALFPDVVDVLGRRDVCWSIVAQQGDPAKLVHDIAVRRGACAIVIGSRGSGIVGRLRALGGMSVTEQLVRRSVVPVVVVPRHQPVALG
jgi:nucleotide-binding universal stress UspA family protein